ncbi:nidogen-2 isoform X2 [Esox lucius]|uniref:nidogen-2 isoform X2 n=1 Tax=Esox lucius TaxID=8010 RepID=UPI0014775009|nr:nidogen-2 isoform X2 [Esox lucius]
MKALVAVLLLSCIVCGVKAQNGTQGNKDSLVSEEQTLTPCAQAGVNTTTNGVGVCVPTCDNQGQYTPLQCCGSTGYCRCVTTSGQDIPGTLTPPDRPHPKCIKRDRTPCEQARHTCPPHFGSCCPKCDIQGQYTPLQCCGSTGYCRCVTTSGQDIPGTLTPPGRPHPKCIKTDLTPCEQDTANCPHVLGRCCPKCDNQGQYTPLQCCGSTGYCRCVTTLGQDISGTLTPPDKPQPTCNKTDRTPCEQARVNCPPVPGRCCPTCDNQGQYTPVQCCGSTGICRCVDPLGRTIPCLHIPTGSPHSNGLLNKSEEQALTPCEQANTKCHHLIGSCCPTCDNQGQYTPLQCCGSTGYCRCVTTSGQDIPGTLTPPDRPHPKCIKTDLTPCEQDTANCPHVLGRCCPKCDNQGQYTPLQCCGSTGYCRCVTTLGHSIPGTLTPPGGPRPKCTKTDLTPCERARDNCPRVPGRCCPTCDNQGQYNPVQCCGSTGYCWCVTIEGQEIPGTLTPPGRPRPNCQNQ